MFIGHHGQSYMGNGSDVVLILHTDSELEAQRLLLEYEGYDLGGSDEDIEAEWLDRLTGEDLWEVRPVQFVPGEKVTLILDESY